MKKLFILLSLISILFLGSSCKKKDSESDEKGYITFGANYGRINCLSSVTIFIDGKEVGKLTEHAEEVLECGVSGNVTKELSVGSHSYRIEIRPTNGGNCHKDISGDFTTKEGECKKVFIDFTEIFYI